MTLIPEEDGEEERIRREHIDSLHKWAWDVFPADSKEVHNCRVEACHHYGIFYSNVVVPVIVAEAIDRNTMTPCKN